MNKSEPAALSKVQMSVFEMCEMLIDFRKPWYGFCYTDVLELLLKSWIWILNIDKSPRTHCPTWSPMMHQCRRPPRCLFCCHKSPPWQTFYLSATNEKINEIREDRRQTEAEEQVLVLRCLHSVSGFLLRTWRIQHHPGNQIKTLS